MKSTTAAYTGMNNSMTMMVPKPTPMGGSGITPLKASTTNLTGKGGTTSGGNMTGCTACGKATKPVPTPKKM